MEIYIYHISRRKRNISRCLLVCVLLLGMISGCALTQDYHRPQMDIPQNWRVDYEAAADMANTAWWEQFQDPVLNELIKTALNENNDLRVAVANVEEFEGRLQAAQSGFYPQIDYWNFLSRDSQSRKRSTPALARGLDRINSSYQAHLNISWELDLWGRVRRSTEAARADLLSAEAGRQAVILSLVSAVASGYINLLNLDKQLEISRRTLVSREEWLRLFEKKFKGGQVSSMELAQAKSAYEQAAGYIPQLKLQITTQENSLSVLLGRFPGTIKRGKTLDMLVIPQVPQGIPSDLLEQRPDIRQSEQNLIAANARIGIVKTQYFPNITLTGIFGYASLALSDLLRGSANLWQTGVGAVGHIFSGGRIKGEILQAEAKQQQLLNEYFSTIKTAFKEVNDSLVTIQRLRELLEIQVRHIDALKDYNHFSRSRYDAEFSSYLEVQNAEADLFAAEIRYAQTLNDIFIAMVNIYKALGGGWVAKTDQQIVKAEPIETEVSDKVQETDHTGRAPFFFITDKDIKNSSEDRVSNDTF